ncbi:hypothetical protein J6590_073249 [Homalodisca vitripennis]|nr:hypothetical protein J6590_073249 [Homalodisca vitripennis]
MDSSDIEEALGDDSLSELSDFVFSGSEYLPSSDNNSDDSGDALSDINDNEQFESVADDHIVKETNRYAHQHLSSVQLKRRSMMRQWIDCSTEEIKTLFGIFMVMGNQAEDEKLKVINIECNVEKHQKKVGLMEFL